jgi:hypothetical protein
MRDAGGSNESLALKRLVTRQCEATQRARALYRVVRFAGQISRLLSWLAGRPDHLMEAAEILPDEITAHRSSRLQSVPICRIVASERRSREFDGAFQPLRDGKSAGWTKIAALRLLGADLPPVDLIQIGKVYMVRDGHKRISVACALGEESIEARITTLECSASINDDCRREADNGFAKRISRMQAFQRDGGWSDPQNF